MIICSCEGISDRCVRAAIEDGARSVRQVADACGAATGCGKCACDLKRMLRQASGHPTATPATVPRRD